MATRPAVRWLRRLRLPVVAGGCLAILPIARATTAAFAPPPQFGVVLTELFPGGTFEISVSSQGVASTESTLTSTGVTPAHGAIVRYADQRLFMLDYATHTYVEQQVRSALDSRAVEDAAAANVVVPDVPPISLPPIDRGSATALPEVIRIHGLRASAYLLNMGGRTEREWFALDLPAPPADVQALLDAYDATSPGPAFHFATGKILLRREIQTPVGWIPVLDTVRVQRAWLGDDVFAPPADWTSAIVDVPHVAAVRGILNLFRNRDGGNRLPTLSGFAARTTTSRAGLTPARIGTRRPALMGSVPAVLQQPGNGPVLSNPKIFSLYWGVQFPQRPTFVTRMNTSLQGMGDASYSGALGQYGIHRGLVIGSGTVDQSPPKAIGSFAVNLIADFVFTARWAFNGPKVWWRFGGEDPVYTVFVPMSSLDNGWDAFHLFTLTEAAGLPFPLNLAAHAVMPWTITKVRDVDLNVGIDPNASIDDTSTRTSHEYVEATTDPIPFLTWYDPGKIPAWEQGEVADICEMPSVLPWGEWTRVTANGGRLATYWSNADKACVPESRPTISIITPAPNATVVWHHPVAVKAAAHDPVSGILPNATTDIIWLADGVEFVHQSVMGNPPQTPLELAPGPHTLTARVTVPNSPVWLSAQAAVAVTVVAKPPIVSLQSPTPDSSWGADQTIPFRASAIDPQGDPVGYVWTVDGNAISFLSNDNKQLALGDHQVQITASNLVPLSSSIGPFTIHVLPATGLPSVLLLNPLGQDQITNCSKPVVFSVNAFDAKGPIPDQQIVWQDDHVGQLGTGATITHQYTCGLAPIDHVITVTATNAKGSTSVTFVLTVGTVG